MLWDRSQSMWVKSLMRFFFLSVLRGDNWSHQWTVIKKKKPYLWVCWIFESKKSPRIFEFKVLRKVTRKDLTDVKEKKEKNNTKDIATLVTVVAKHFTFSGIYQWPALISLKSRRWHSSTNTVYFCFCSVLMLWRRKPSCFTLKTSWFWGKK